MNIAEILKDCPKGTKLYSPLCGECNLSEIDGYIRIFDSNVNYYYFYHDGSYVKTGECLLFPSKENRDWSKFQRPFKDGDIVFYNDTVAIFKEWGDDTLFRTHCVFYTNVSNKIYSIEIDRPLFGKYIRKHIRFATEDEKRMLFDAIKVNGYKWNEETKTLEKLIEPKFKVGDKIIKRDSIVNSWIISSVSSEYYGLKLPNGSEGIGVLSIAEQDDYELVPDIKPKFKVGDKIVHKENRNNPFVITDIINNRYKGGTQYEILIEQQDNFELVTEPKFKVGDRIKKKDIDDVYAVEIAKIVQSIYTFTNGNWQSVESVDKDYELVPSKFDITTLKPFDKVLVRDSDKEYWCINFFGFYNKITEQFHCIGGTNIGWDKCIPYEGNEHLLGTTDDCDEFYKTW